MKKIFLIVGIAGFIISCGDKGTKTETTKGTEATQEQTMDAEAQKGLDLVAKNNCFQCHKISEKLIGPPYDSVALRYKGNAAITDTLVQRIIRGSSGNWGTVPMIPHPTLSVEDARTMVHYILSLK